MKALVLRKPGRALTLPRFAALSAATVQKIAAFTAAACVIMAWLCAFTERSAACCVFALVGVASALVASEGKGGEL